MCSRATQERRSTRTAQERAFANKQVRQTMRWIHIGVIVAFTAVILIFALQNLESVTMSFLGFRISAPLAVVAVVLYLWGWLPAEACGS